MDARRQKDHSEWQRSPTRYPHRIRSVTRWYRGRPTRFDMALQPGQLRWLRRPFFWVASGRHHCRQRPEGGVVRLSLEVPRRGLAEATRSGDEEGSGVNLPPVCLQPKNSLEAGPDMGEAIPKSICRRPSRLPDRGRAINLDLDAGWWCCWCCWCCRLSCRRRTGSLSEPVPETRVKIRRRSRLKDVHH